MGDEEELIVRAHVFEAIDHELDEVGVRLSRDMGEAVDRARLRLRRLQVDIGRVVERARDDGKAS